MQNSYRTSDIKNRRTKNNPPKKNKKFLGKIGLGGVITIFLLFSIGFITVDQLIVPSIKASKPLSILLVGSDMNAYREDHYSGTKPEKTDSLIVVTFNPSTFRFVATSIPRDTAVDYACGDIRGKINEIYPVSGNKISCLTKSVEDYLNIPIDYYIKVDMDQVENIIDKVAPIEIVAHAQDGYLSQANVKGDKTYSWVNGKKYSMDADEALTYSRARHDSEKDYGRGRRQQQVILAVAQNILAEGINFGIIKDMFNSVDTNMKPLLMKSYYDYAKKLNKVFDAIAQNKTVKKSELSDTTWINLFEYFKYDKKEVTEQNVKSFQQYLAKNYSDKKIKGYFYESNQFYNTTYGGFYVTPHDQLKKISNKLRVNLGLPEQDPKDPSKPFGTNNFEKQVTKGSNGGYVSVPVDNSTNNTNNNSNNTVDTTDSDGDGIPDKSDDYPNGEDKIDTDGDGTPDINDDYPNDEDKVDTDGDGTPDINDDYPNDEDKVDTDGDGIPDIDDEYPNGEDKVDTDGDGISDVDENKNGTDPNDPNDPTPSEDTTA